MANAAEASASTARPRKKKAAQGETPAARKNGANKGTVKGREGESSRLPPFPFEQVPLYGEATLRSWGAVLLYALVCGMTEQLIM